MKELYIAAHEELIERYCERHPEVSWEQAYDLCADRAYDHMVDKLADRADYLRKARREEGDTCGDCGVGAGEHAEDCPRLAEP